MLDALEAYLCVVSMAILKFGAGIDPTSSLSTTASRRTS